MKYSSIAEIEILKNSVLIDEGLRSNARNFRLETLHGLQFSLSQLFWHCWVLTNFITFSVFALRGKTCIEEVMRYHFQNHALAF